MEFKIILEEKDKLDAWEYNHPCEFTNKMNQPAAGGRLTFSFTPTGLGTIKKVRCECGAEKDLTVDFG